MSERFQYRENSQSIKDNLTGYIYSDLGTVTDLLNELDNNKVMKKHGIKSLERLDHILFYARKW